MDKNLTFEQFLATQTPHINLFEFSINLLLTALLTGLLSFVYVKYGTALSNRRMFAKNLVIIAMTTMLIITIVKSSLALSLGLVGALSIVRFRTPIKEPEELAYLFLSIAIGLGLGAGQVWVVFIGYIMIVIAIWVRHSRNISSSDQSMHLMITASNPTEDLLQKIVAVLETYASAVKLRRVDEGGNQLQSDFLLNFDDYDKFNQTRMDLQQLHSELDISFMDNQLI